MGAATESSYLESVQALYLQLRGGGLTLSPVDADRIRSWRDAGVPLELALQAVRAAHAAWSSGGPRLRPFPLRSAERWVAEFVGRHERRGGARGGRPAPEPEGQRTASESPLPRCIARIEARLAASAPPVRAAYAAALAHLAAHAGATAGIDRILATADEAQALAYLRALDRPVQRGLALGARRAAGPRAGMPRRSYRAMLRAHLCDAARAHGGFLRPSDLT